MNARKTRKNYRQWKVSITMSILQKRIVINLWTTTSIIVPGGNKIMSMFSSSNDIVIPWQQVKCIGDDIILVDI